MLPGVKSSKQCFVRRSQGNLKLARTLFGGKFIFPQEKKMIIWPRPERNPLFFLEGGYWCMAMLDFLWHLRTFLGLITWLSVIYCIVLHPTVVTSSRPPSDKLFPSTHEGVTLQRPAARLSVYREGTEGVALGGMLLLCQRGDSRQLCDPESTFERQLKHKQTPPTLQALLACFCRSLSRSREGRGDVKPP